MIQLIMLLHYYTNFTGYWSVSNEVQGERQFVAIILPNLMGIVGWEEEASLNDRLVWSYF